MPYVFILDGQASEPVGVTRALGRVSKLGLRHGPKHRISTPEGSLSAPSFLPKVVGKVTRWTVTAKEGSSLRLTHGTENKEPLHYRLKKVVVKPSHRDLIHYTGRVVDLSEGNPRVAEVGQWAADNYVRVRCSGYAYTRNVAGSSTWSQHSRFVGGCNAIDLTFYRGDDAGPVDSDALALFVSALVREARIGGFQLRRIIYLDKDYRRDHGWAPIKYTGVYHSSHVHVEGEPYNNTRPVDA